MYKVGVHLIANISRCEFKNLIKRQFSLALNSENLRTHLKIRIYFHRNWFLCYWTIEKIVKTFWNYLKTICLPTLILSEFHLNKSKKYVLMIASAKVRQYLNLANKRIRLMSDKIYAKSQRRQEFTNESSRMNSVYLYWQEIRAYRYSTKHA